MAEANLAEDLDLNPQETKQDQQDQKKTEAIDNSDTNGLSANDVKRMKEQGISIKDLAREREQLKTAAEAKMKEFVTVQGEHGALITTKEYSDLARRLEEAKGPEETQKILDEINGIPQEKESAAQQEKDDAIELPPNDPKLLELQRKFKKISDDNVKYIGKKQIAGNKAWFEQERSKKPTAGHLKDLIAKMEGTEVEHKEGLAPRRQEYAKLAELFKKYGLGAPEDNNDWIRQEGLSERQDFRKKIEAFEDHFAKLKDTGFYSPEMIKKYMGELLKAENPTVLSEKLKAARELAREESEGFTHLDEHIQIGGISIRKMSTESKNKFLEYYKTLDISERQKLMNESMQKKGLKFFENLANGEACLAKNNPKYTETYSTHGVQALDQIYKDDPDTLKLALQSFEHLDFMQKVEALKKHAVLAKTAKSKEELETDLIKQGIKANLAVAKSKNSISAETEKRYIDFFNKPENFKNPDTKKPGDFKEFKKAYAMLISVTPNEELKNLAAYEERRKKFEKDLKQLQEINPSISDDDLKKWQAKYDKEGWTKREQIHKQELLPKISLENEDRKKRIGIEGQIGKKDETKEKKEGSEKITLEELIKAVTALMANGQGGEAVTKMMEYMSQGSEKEQAAKRKDEKFQFFYKMATKYVMKFGTGKKSEESVEKELEVEMEQIANTDKGTQDKLAEQQIKTLNLEGVKQSEQRHNQTISGQERARKESMGRVQQGTVEGDLTADAYKKLGKEFMVDKEGKAKKIEQIQFKDNSINMQEQDRFRMKRETFKEQTKLDKKEGMFTAMKDKQGNAIDHHVAENLQKAELARLEEEMAKKAQEKVDARTTSADTRGAKIFNLQSNIAARRKAKELIDAKRNERLKAA